MVNMNKTCGIHSGKCRSKIHFLIWCVKQDTSEKIDVFEKYFAAMIHIVSTKYFTIWVHLCTEALIQSTRWTPVTSCLVHQTISTTS